MVRMACKAVIIPVIVFLIGCGSASVTKDEATPSTSKPLNVKVQIDNSSNVKPGDTVRLVATVDKVQAESITFNWINVTGWGELTGDIHSNTVVWKAPDTLPSGSFKVEVIQLVVTAIRHVISTTETGVEVNTEVLTETKTIPITISRTSV